ncbi:MAG TPA: xanthine dehydrogenase family protein molybdopterin-binding subunit [Chondromyces sp.]|nr:xanthine dehydrogenase family protein molybdopterin-binding subunit [Chondromyces sp.]
MKHETPYWLDESEPETPLSSEYPAPWSETDIVGTRLPRVDAYERVSGAAVYPHDVSLPEMLHGAILRCPHAHAKVTRIDTSKAEKMPGVRAVLTPSSSGAEIPWYTRGGKAYSRLLDTHCRHEGEEVAAVAAETPLQAFDALRAIEVEYEVLPFVVDYESALDADAPAVHEGGNLVGEPSVRERGDLEAGFAEADIVIERTYRTACEIHAPMEPHGSVVKWDGNRLTVWDSTQGVYAVQRGVADALGLALANVRVIGHYMGGGFGSKLEVGKYTVIAALMAKTSGRPVKIFLPREDCMLATGNRPANTMTIKIGAASDGTLTAIDYRSIGTGGAYPYGAGSSTLAAYLYRCANVRTEDTTVFINAGKARPMRAPGFPQGAWALDQAMDELAERLGIDPLEMRLRNLSDVAQTGDGTPFTSNQLEACLREGAKAFGWEAARSSAASDGPVRRGVGLAACFWGYAGGPPSTVIVKLFADGSANLNMGASDIGTGTKTWAAMIVAEELGVPMEQIQIEHADTGTTQYATPSGGSKTVPSDSPAVRAAAYAVKHQLLEMAAAQLEVEADELELADGFITSRSNPDTKVAVAELEKLGRQGVVVGTGYRAPNPEDKVTWPFAAQFCEVEVDTRTGEVRLLRFLGAHDSGRVLNRLTFDNQVFGGIAMGVGLAMTEERVLDRRTGKMVNISFHDYKVPTMKDVAPAHECLPIDVPDTEFNTTGTKGLGEPATIPTAAAIANAVAHATGVRVADSPLNPTRLAALFAEQRKEG